MSENLLLAAIALKMREAVPRWYSLAPLHNPPGLELVIHFDTWQRVLSLCGDTINTKSFQASLKETDWVSVKFPFTKITRDACRSLEETLAVLFQTINYVKKDIHPEQHQLVAYGILSSRNELKGYMMEAFVSYEMKNFLKKRADEVGTLATSAMRNAARHFRLPTGQKYFGAFVENGGFLYFGIGDGSGTFLAADYRDREKPDAPVGYVMTSDNIDSPALQLIFLYTLATVSAWGETQ